MVDGREMRLSESVENAALMQETLVQLYAGKALLLTGPFWVDLEGAKYF